MADDLDDLDDYLDEFQDEVFAETDAKEKTQSTQESKESGGDNATSAATAENLKDTIEETLNRLKTKVDPNGKNVDEELEEMMQNMSLDDDITKALMESMGVLMSKSMMYEPLKSLSVKYPDWLDKNKDTLEPKEYERYQLQYNIVNDIVSRFEKEDYDDTKDFDYISGKLEEMETTGNVPDELADSKLGDLSNVEIKDEDLEGCAQQ